MEIPARVSVFNSILELKGKQGTLVAISDQGFYEISLEFKEKNHTVLFPVTDTVLVFNDPLPPTSSEFEIER